MKRYIDVDLLKKSIRANLIPNVDVDGTITVENAERYFLNLIDKISIADIVEVVRCKDCEHYIPDCKICKKLSGLKVVIPNFGCVLGKRKDVKECKN